MTYGIYVHVPFCRRKCDYCAFFSRSLSGTADDDALMDRYVRRLVAESRERLCMMPHTQADTIYLGGGTPSLLGPDRVLTILEALRGCMTVTPDAEVTLELNPGDADSAMVARFRDAGVTRMVLGLQTTDPAAHRFIGRSTPIPTDADLEGFFAVPGLRHCLDLIIGIPGSDGALARDLAVVERFGPDHVSAYLLSIEEGTPLGRRHRIDDAHEELQERQYRETIEFLTGRGYRHYEIANFAMPGGESRHNLRYWRFQPYIGLGPGSHSFYNHERSLNAMSVDEYCASYRVILTPDHRTAGAPVVEYLLTGLRLLEGISIPVMEETLAQPVPLFVRDRLVRAEREGLLVISHDDLGERIRLTERGLFLADTVIYELVQDIL